MAKAPTISMDFESWNRLRTESGEDSAVVEAVYLATRDLVDRLGAIESRLESIELELADREGS